MTQGELQGWVLVAIAAAPAIIAAINARAAKIAAHAAVVAVSGVAADMKILETNTNSKMDQTLAAVTAKGISDTALAEKVGEQRGLEAGRREKP